MLQKIVVIVPLFNSESYLTKCIDSILNQTYQNIDTIIVNDGSTDSSLNIAKQYAINNRSIVVINKNNGGPSSARNVGLRYYFSHYDVTCTFLAFLDSDDFIASDYFLLMVNNMNKHKVDIVCSSFCFFDGDRYSNYKQVEEDKRLSRFEATKLLLEDKTIQSHSHTKLFKGYLWQNITYPINIISMEDQATIFKVFCKAFNGIFISNYSGYFYRQDNSHSITKLPIDAKKINDSINGYKVPLLYEFCEFSPNEKKELISAASQAFVSCFLMMFPRHSLRYKDSVFINNCHFFNKGKYIELYKPFNRKEVFKKNIFRFSNTLYVFLYRLYLLLSIIKFKHKRKLLK